MSNTLLTPTQVTRKALVILHQKLNFVGNVNRQYDDSYAQTGAKIGDMLKIRLPNQYTVTNGAVMTAQDTTEQTVSLQINNQKHVGMNFSSTDLTLSLDDFSDRIIEPAMAVLAAAIERDALDTMRKDVWNMVANTGSSMAMSQVTLARKKLVDSLCPDGKRFALLNTQDNADLVNANKGLFQDSGEIASQYREGMMGRTGGFDFYESTHLGIQLRGAGASYQTNSAAAQTGNQLIVGTGTGLINPGEVFTIAGVNAVHPETKVDLGYLQQFTCITTDQTNATLITFAPSIVATGAQQNVTNGAANTKAVTIVGTASTNYGQSLVFHRDAFAFVTADLVLPKNQQFAAREELDGISMRIWQGTDIINDKFPCRADVLYGYKTIRPQLACRVANTAASF